MISKETDIPGLNGLVLAGGRSKRMGTDKALMKWHGEEQRYHIADILMACCDEVFISCRPDQQHEIDASCKTLPDIFLNKGPLGGILSAFSSQPSKAWLVVACDLPLLNEDTISFLIAARDPKKYATTYKSPHDGLPEPLIAIWEPRSYPVLLNSFEEGITCPRKVLMKMDKKILEPLHPETLMNVNTPEDAIIAKQIIQERSNKLDTYE